MQLHIARHAHATSVGSGHVREDRERSLTLEGRGTVQRIAGLLQERGVRLDRILTSPVMRAVQTAEILAAGLAYPGAVEALPLLARTGAWRKELPSALDALQRADLQDVMLVGHNPDISDLAAQLMGRPEGTLSVHPGTVCRFNLRGTDVNGASLDWWLDPRTHEFRTSF